MYSVQINTPKNWNHYSGEKVEVYPDSEEYKQIVFEVEQATGLDPSLFQRMIRIQNLYFYSQFLIQEQLRLHLSNSQLYKVRRYIYADKNYLSEIIKSNLDPRKCGLNGTLAFRKSLYNFLRKNLIVVVKVLTVQPNSETISPERTNDYYIEYIIVLN